MFLEIKDLKKFYGEKENRICVLKGVNLSIEEGSIVVILGPSGSGKSTILNIIGGLEVPDNGTILINGKKIDNMKASNLGKYRRDMIGFIFQSYNLIPNLTVKENIELCQKLGDKAIDIDEVIDLLGLTEHKNKFPRYLSGGQQQRTAIARAIVKNPKLLLCDEPTGALDYETSKETLRLLEAVRKKYGTTILMVTHNEAIGKMADKILKISGGEIAKEIVVENPLSVDEIEW